MKVVLVSTYAAGGGAANAAIRLLEALRSRGVDARLIALWGEDADIEKANDRPYIDILTRHGGITRLRAKANKALERLDLLPHLLPSHLTSLWRISSAPLGLNITTHPWIREADIIHLQWTCHGLLSLPGLKALASLGKPILWTLHDLWAVTGGCHLPFAFRATGAELCPRLGAGCGSCPLLGSRASAGDLTSRLHARKAFLRQSPFGYVAVSHSVAELFARATGQSVSAIIPPALDIAPLEPAPQQPAWYDPSRIYMLISAARLDDTVKGMPLLRETMQALARLAPEALRQRLTLVLAGDIRQRETLGQLPLQILQLGRISGEELHAISYHAHIVLSTSLYETYGQTLTEALAVGTPVIAFASGGPRDIVSSAAAGRLVEPYDTEAFARAILAVAQESEQGIFTRAERRASLPATGSEAVADAHIRLYTSLGKH